MMMMMMYENLLKDVYSGLMIIKIRKIRKIPLNAKK